MGLRTRWGSASLGRLGGPSTPILCAYILIHIIFTAASFRIEVAFPVAYQNVFAIECAIHNQLAAPSETDGAQTQMATHTICVDPHLRWDADRAGGVIGVTLVA